MRIAEPIRPRSNAERRFTSPDTIIPDAADPQSFNRYSYVNNNPVNFTDPSGHRAVPDDCYYGGGCGSGSSVGAGRDGTANGYERGAADRRSMGQADDKHPYGPPAPPHGWRDEDVLTGGRSSWDILNYIFVNGNASILTWGVGVTAQGETLTLDLGEGWAGPRTLLEVFKGKLGAAALSAGFRSSPDEKISEVSYSLEVFALQGAEVQWGRTTDGSGLFGEWWVGAGYGIGVGATMMRWFSVPIAVLPED